MTETAMRTRQISGQPSQTEEIPGIPAVEFDVMQAAAARLLGGQDVGSVAADLRALREPADVLAAGAMSARRDEYNKVSGVHWMLMPYLAG